MNYPNIKAELKRNGVTYADVGSSLGLSVVSLSDRLNGRIRLTVEEAKAIRDRFCPDATLDYLLEGPSTEEPED